MRAFGLINEMTRLHIHQRARLLAVDIDRIDAEKMLCDRETTQVVDHLPREFRVGKRAPAALAERSASEQHRQFVGEDRSEHGGVAAIGPDCVAVDDLGNFLALRQDCPSQSNQAAAARAGVNLTGMCLIPATKLDRSRSGLPASCMSGKRVSSSSSITRNSSRARLAPTQKCSPCAKAR